MTHLTAEIARELLRYDPETGQFWWRSRDVHWFQDKKHSAALNCKKWNARFAGKEAFSVNDEGYLCALIFGQNYKAHRIAWLIVTESWPLDQIDHINGIRNDNRWCNLRAVTNAQNNRNRKKASNNTSGVVGVSWSKRTQKWTAQIYVDNECIRLGHFTNKDDAIAARKAAEREHNFHENHGRAV